MKVGIREAARQLGVSHVALIKARKTGALRADPDGRLDVDQVRKSEWWKNRGGPLADPPAGNGDARSTAVPGGNSEAAGRRVEVELEPQPRGGALKREHAIEEEDGGLAKIEIEKLVLLERREKLHLDNEERKGTLVDAAEASEAWGNMITTARNKALMLPSELAPKLARESDTVACEEILRTGIYAMLSELASWSPASQPIADCLPHAA